MERELSTIERRMAQAKTCAEWASKWNTDQTTAAARLREGIERGAFVYEPLTSGGCIVPAFRRADLIDLALGRP